MTRVVTHQLGIIPINDSSIVKICVSTLVVPARASETAILLIPSLILPGTEKEKHQCER